MSMASMQAQASSEASEQEQKAVQKAAPVESTAKGKAWEQLKALVQGLYQMEQLYPKWTLWINMKQDMDRFHEFFSTHRYKEVEKSITLEQLEKWHTYFDHLHQHIEKEIHQVQVLWDHLWPLVQKFHGHPGLATNVQKDVAGLYHWLSSTSCKEAMKTYNLGFLLKQLKKWEEYFYHLQVQMHHARMARASAQKKTESQPTQSPSTHDPASSKPVPSSHTTLSETSGSASSASSNPCPPGSGKNLPDPSKIDSIPVCKGVSMPKNQLQCNAKTCCPSWDPTYKKAFLQCAGQISQWQKGLKQKNSTLSNADIQYLEWLAYVLNNCTQTCLDMNSFLAQIQKDWKDGIPQQQMAIEAAVIVNLALITLSAIPVVGEVVDALNAISIGINLLGQIPWKPLQEMAHYVNYPLNEATKYLAEGLIDEAKEEVKNQKLKSQAQQHIDHDINNDVKNAFDHVGQGFTSGWHAVSHFFSSLF